MTSALDPKRIAEVVEKLRKRKPFGGPSSDPLDLEAAALIERLAVSQAETRRLALEEAARVVKPSGNRPCDCDRCDCGNVGDAEAVAAWDALDAPYRAIRALIDQPSTEGEKNAQ